MLQVETIGDAYMVASGVPDRSPNYASEIARMALEIRNGIVDFKVRCTYYSYFLGKFRLPIELVFIVMGCCTAQ
jgi:Adenylate and Guanylate cyclase catalytic domain